MPERTIRRRGSGAIDVHVGKRLRAARMLRGMSQTGLGDALGISFQQIQKYEKGTNRIGVGTLYVISKTLNVPIGYFFEGLERPAQTELTEGGPESTGKSHDDETSLLGRRESRTLFDAYYRIDDERVRRQFVALLKAFRGDQCSSR